MENLQNIQLSMKTTSVVVKNFLLSIFKTKFSLQSFFKGPTLLSAHIVNPNLQPKSVPTSLLDFNDLSHLIKLMDFFSKCSKKARKSLLTEARKKWYKSTKSNPNLETKTAQKHRLRELSLRSRSKERKPFTNLHIAQIFFFCTRFGSKSDSHSRQENLISFYYILELQK